jgi:hypothetical protein
MGNIDGIDMSEPPAPIGRALELDSRLIGNGLHLG